jgi:tetratricopeptide (TPR) repeat protein
MLSRFAIAAMLLPLAAAAAPHIDFVRVIPATHDLSAERVALLYATGERDRLATFIDTFLDFANRGSLRVDDEINHPRHRGNDAYLGIDHFTCTMTDHSGEGSTRDTTGERVKRRQVWTDAVCTGRMDVLDANGKKRYSFAVRGEGTSPRVVELGTEERVVALDQAARFAAITAAESVQPRRVRETIVLDDTAPSFEEAMSMIDADRLRDARAIWETALRRHPDSAALHFDIAAVSEAMGDLQAAGDHFREALRLSPRRQEYRSELELFRRRNAAKPSSH